MPAKNLIRVQVGKESSWGTPVAATAIWMLVSEPSVEYSAKPIALTGPGTLGIPLVVADGDVEVSGSLKYYASYEDILYPLVGLFGQVTPSGTGPYTWTFTAPVTSAPSAQSYTLETGAPGAEYRVIGALVSGLEISGSAGEAVEVTADFIARDLAAQSMTSGLSVRSVNPVVMTQATLYVDPWSGTIGTTAVPATLIDFSLRVETGRHMKYFTSRLAEGWGEGDWSGTLEMTLEFNANAKGYADAILSAVDKRLIQIKFADTTSRELTLQFAGASDGSVKYYDDRDNNITVKLAYQAHYHAGLATWFKAIVKNNLSALP